MSEFPQDDGSQEPLLGVNGSHPLQDGQGPSSNVAAQSSTLGKFVRGETEWGYYFEEGNTVILWITIVGYILLTVPELEQYEPYVDLLGGITGIITLIEYLVKIWTAVERPEWGFSRMRFFTSFFSLVDLLTLVPYLVSLFFLGGRFYGLQFLRILRLFSRFNADKASGKAGAAIGGVLKNSASLLISTTYFLISLWFMIAACYHIAERGNPEMDGRFDTFLGSMWYTLINMVGEYPINMELSSWGKVIGTITMIIAIGGVQGIPTGIITDGFSRYVEEAREQEGFDDDVDEDTILLDAAQLEMLSAGIDANNPRDSFDRLYLFINGYTPAGEMVEGFVIFLVVLNVASNIIGSVPEIKANPGWAAYYQLLEPVSVVIFTAEYLIRFVAMGAHQEYRGFGRIRWMFTFFALVDLVAVLPWYLDLFITGHDVIPTTFVRVLRLVRIVRVFKTGKFVDGIGVFTGVVYAKIPLLSSVLYGVQILWVLASVGMYYTERENPIPLVRENFNTVPNAMWITFLNFSGEYPLADYTTAGKILSSCVAFVAIAVFGIPIAILSDGMAEQFERLEARGAAQAEAEAPEEEAELRDSALMQLSILEVASQTSIGSVFLFMKGNDLGGEGLEALEDEEGDVKVHWWEAWGVRFELFVLALILVNTIAFILQSDPSVPIPDNVYKALENFSVAVYSIEYVLRLLATYGDPELDEAWYRPFNFFHYVFSYFGVIDVAAVAPWYMKNVFGLEVASQLTILRSLRLMRLLRVERYLPGFLLLHRVWQKRYFSLVASIYIMVICTVFFATLLHLTEKDNTTGDVMNGGISNADRYRSVPSSFWFTFIHLTGDYPLYQYSAAGRVINFAMIILAQGLVGIPLGIIVEGFQSEMSEKIEETNRIKEIIAGRLSGGLEEITTETADETSKDDIANEQKPLLDNQPTQPEAPPAVSVPDPEAPSEARSGVSSAGSCTAACFPRRSPAEASITKTAATEIPQDLSSKDDAAEGTGKSVVQTDTEDSPKITHNMPTPRSPDSKALKAVAKEIDADSAGLENLGSPHQRMVHRQLESMCFFRMQMLSLVLVMLGILVHTDESIQGTLFYRGCNLAQWGASVFFTCTYFIRLYACPADVKFEGRNEYAGTGWSEWRDWPRLCYATDFVGMVDLLSFVTLYIAVLFPEGSTTCVSLRMLQVLVILKIDRRLPAYSLLDDVLTSERGSGRLLFCSAALALILWTLFAALFYIFEKDVATAGGCFDTMPVSMFVTMIFLGGEWMMIDLEVPFGELVGVVLVFVGIGVCGIPVAIFFDGYMQIAEEYDSKLMASFDQEQAEDE